MKKLILLICFVIFPVNAMAYSDYIYRGGNTLGIEVNCKGILIVGFYEINGEYNKGNPKLKVGDYITKIEGKPVNTLKDLTKEFEKYTDKKEVEVTYRRDYKEYTTNIELIKSEGLYKTGLYVKDSITGIGTLTYIDPISTIYGALGHEIIESNTNSIVEIKDGSIFKNKIIGIEKSTIGHAGSKSAKYDYNSIYGTIFKNTNYGIFGNYKEKIDQMELVKVGSIEDIKIGKASIYTVINGENVEEYSINIKEINEESNSKNIVFEITDKDLIEKTGGVIQGMSGSPIMQDEMIVGVVTHVIVDNPITGYGLFITKMLEEGEK